MSSARESTSLHYTYIKHFSTKSHDLLDLAEKTVQLSKSRQLFNPATVNSLTDHPSVEGGEVVSYQTSFEGLLHVVRDPAKQR